MYNNLVCGKNIKYPQKGVYTLEEKLEGSLIIIGGAEDKKGDKKILKEVCKKIDKEKDVLVIATVASELPEELGDEYKNIFEELGVKNIRILNIRERKDAYDRSNVQYHTRCFLNILYRRRST